MVPSVTFFFFNETITNSMKLYCEILLVDFDVFHILEYVICKEAFCLMQGVEGSSYLAFPLD